MEITINKKKKTIVLNLTEDSVTIDEIYKDLKELLGDETSEYKIKTTNYLFNTNNPVGTWTSVDTDNILGMPTRYDMTNPYISNNTKDNSQL